MVEVTQMFLQCTSLIYSQGPPPTPHQLTVSQSELSEKKTVVWRSFQQSWFNQWTWLHYDEANDLADIIKMSQNATKSISEHLIFLGEHAPRPT